MKEHDSKSIQNHTSHERAHYHYLDRLVKTTAKRNNICFTIASAFIGYAIYFSKSLNVLTSKCWLLFSLIFFVSTLISSLFYYIFAENSLLRRIEFLPKYYSGAPASEEEKGASFSFANFFLNLSPILLVLGIITFTIFSYDNLGNNTKQNTQEVLEAPYIYKVNSLNHQNEKNGLEKKHLPKPPYPNSIKEKSLPTDTREISKEILPPIASPKFRN